VDKLSTWEERNCSEGNFEGHRRLEAEIEEKAQECAEAGGGAEELGIWVRS